ncbi:hypothetical protein OS493_026291 [Desmophyllum pertusum]|uniref:Uncharacterized protein n=1 Tax=Desmophyllum pertusum TaxID=174260 RepID=A0A9X0D1U2_9CNID|nr:hypothetical protein OS493_026291 [Desmophyllum pertusum]
MDLGQTKNAENLYAKAAADASPPGKKRRTKNERKTKKSNQPPVKRKSRVTWKSKTLNQRKRNDPENNILLDV